MGEALGLEMVAQKAVEELGSKGLLDEKGMLAQLKKMQSQGRQSSVELRRNSSKIWLTEKWN